MSNRTKAWLLAILMLVLVGVLSFRFMSQDEPARVPLTHKTGERIAKESAAKPTGVPTVAKLASLRDADATFRTPKNIFAPLDQPSEETRDLKTRPRLVKSEMKAPIVPVVAPLPPTPAPPPPSPEELAAQQARLQREQATQLARQLMGQYRFIGFLTQNGEPRAFVGKGRELFIVRAGDTLEGQIHVATIEPSSLKLRDATSRVETALPLLQGGKTVGF